MLFQVGYILATFWKFQQRGPEAHSLRVSGPLRYKSTALGCRGLYRIDCRPLYIMMTNIHTTEQLKVALRNSETHARTYAIEHYNTPFNYRRQNEPGYLAISASPKKVKKAIKIFGSFLTRLIQQGVTINLACPGARLCPSSSLVMDGHYFPIRIKEIFAVQEVKNKYRNFTQTLPTGRFVIEIYKGPYHRPAKTITTQNEEEWPDKASGVIFFLKDVVAQSKAHEAENELWRKQQEENEKRRKEKESILRERVEIAKAVVEDIRLFERAEIMRKFCDNAEQRSHSEEYKKVIAIARSVADWIDSTTDYTDPILAQRYRASDFI